MRKNKKKKIDDGYEDTFDDLTEEDLKDPIIVHRGPLPSPKEFAAALKKLRITIQLDLPTVLYFRDQAEKHGVKYQSMIRKVLTSYVENEKRAA